MTAAQVNSKKLPWSAAVLPTEWILGPTRRLIPPVGGVDISPIIWFAFLSFTNEILVGPQVGRICSMSACAVALLTTACEVTVTEMSG